MFSASSSRMLVSSKYSRTDFPRWGEVIALRFSQNLFGPGSEIATPRNLPTGATRYNYHYAIVVQLVLDDSISLTIFPMPAYSSTDPVLGLSSTRWLLAQPDDFQRLHITVPYEDATRTQQHPSFPTPAEFGGPLEMGGWRNCRPSSRNRKDNDAQFKRFEPRVTLSEDEVWRLTEYCRLRSPPGIFTIEPCVSHRISLPRRASLPLRTLYANDAVKHPLDQLTSFPKPDPENDVGFDSDSESDSDDNSGDNMDPITFLRYYAVGDPVLQQVVQEHDQRVRERINQGIANWAEKVHSDMIS